MNGTSSIKEFRQINLVGCIYKLITKVLARRMARVLDKIIAECQQAFVGNRQTLHAVLIANEVVDEVVSSKRDDILCKLDRLRLIIRSLWTTC